MKVLANSGENIITYIEFLKLFDFLSNFINKYIIKPFNWLIHYRDRKKYMENVWKPTLNTINTKLEEFFSKEALDNFDDEEDIEINSNQNNKKYTEIMGQRIQIYVPYDTMKEKDQSSIIHKNMLTTIRSKRSYNLVKHLKSDLRKAVTTIADNKILHDHNIKINLEEQNEDNIILEEMIEDLFDEKALHEIFQTIKSRFGHKSTSHKIQTEILAMFNRAHRLILRRSRGIILYLSPAQLKAYNRLNIWFVASKPESNIFKAKGEWYLFVCEEKKDKIIEVATLSTVKKGKFSDLRKKYKPLIKEFEPKPQSMNKKFEMWLKGVGAKSTNKKRKTGSSLDVLCFIIRDKYGDNSMKIEMILCPRVITTYYPYKMLENYLETTQNINKYYQISP